jgi:lipoprotein-anchoring transpeptidase ErfK/SrfK
LSLAKSKKICYNIIVSFDKLRITNKNKNIMAKFLYKITFFTVIFLFAFSVDAAIYYRTPEVKVYKNLRGQYTKKKNFLVYEEEFQGGATVAIGDLGGDGISEIITGSGMTSRPLVKTFRSNGSYITSFLAYAENMDKGINVATGDLDGDGKDEIITAPRSGGGPHVRVFTGTGKPKFNLGFFAYNYNFHGGVNVAACDVDGDGRDEIVTGPGPNSGPQVRVFKYNGMWTGQDFWPFSEQDRGGVSVGCANVDGGAEEEIIMAVQSEGDNLIKVYKANDVQTVVGFFNAWPEGVRTGINVAGGDVDGDRRDEIVASVAGAGGPQVKVFEAYGKEINPGFFTYEEDFRGGVNVAVGNIDNEKKAEIITAPSKLKPTGRTDLERYVLVDLSEQRLYAYREGYLENSFLISSGLTGPTPTGEFHIFHKIYNHLYSGPGYYLPNTLYNMEFYPHYYLHGAYWHNNFGHPMSHGCVNISYPNAEWLYNWTDVGTTVFVQP